MSMDLLCLAGIICCAKSSEVRVYRYVTPDSVCVPLPFPRQQIPTTLGFPSSRGGVLLAVHGYNRRHVQR